MAAAAILTHTLNSITKKIVQGLFLAVGLIMTGHAILTPLLMVLTMITGCAASSERLPVERVVSIAKTQFLATWVRAVFRVSYQTAFRCRR